MTPSPSDPTNLHVGVNSIVPKIVLRQTAGVMTFGPFQEEKEPLDLNLQQ